MTLRTFISLLSVLLVAAGTGSRGADLPIIGLAHVAFQSSGLETSRSFYTGILGLELAFTTREGADEAWHFKVNDDQFVKLVRVPGPTAEDRLLEVALQVTDVGLTARLLRERGLSPSPLEIRPDGTRATELRDPDGHLLAFVEYLPEAQQTRTRGQHLGARRVSDRLWHAGVIVENEQSARVFYEDKLGFVETWRGGPEGQPTAWINVRMPGTRGDYLEYMLYREKPGRDRLGSMHHVCFQVPDIRAAHASLRSHGLPDIERHHPRLGRNGYWQFNTRDPDGTRSEVMEPHLATSGAAEQSAARAR